MGENGFLTWNYRKDNEKPNLWRDYQQYLPDLGLIYSTEIISSEVRLTPISLMFISGEISFSELMDTQTLRFQYPNGQKIKMPKWAIIAYNEDKRELPESPLQAYLDYGILIRPGLFMLRCLAELANRGLEPEIDIDEALAYMVTSKVDSDWIYAVENIIKARSEGKRVFFNRQENSVQLRHVSEWFRQMATTSFCINYTRKQALILKLKADNKEEIDRIMTICDDFSSIPYWIPDLNASNKEIRLSWFSFYGSADANSIVDSEQLDNPSMLEPRDSGESLILGNNEKLKIKKVEYREYIEREYKDIVINIDKYKEGRKKLEDSSLLHERIVFELAKKLSDDGYDVSADAASADLVAEREGKHILFEVKTVTKKKAGHRIRLGVGQLSEYRYRYEKQNKIRPESCIVISSELPVADWYKNYFMTDIKMGLLARIHEGSFSSLIPTPHFEI